MNLSEAAAALVDNSSTCAWRSSWDKVYRTTYPEDTGESERPAASVFYAEGRLVIAEYFSQLRTVYQPSLDDITTADWRVGQRPWWMQVR